MTDKELRRLSRMELIQLLLEQTREMERLQRELDEVKEELNDRRILLSRAGSIAEAAVQINRLMETAQAAADQYVANVKRETKRQCAQMLQEAKRKAEDYGGGA